MSVNKLGKEVHTISGILNGLDKDQGCSPEDPYYISC